MAREGKDVELKPRPVTISEFTVLDIRSGFVAGEQAAEPLREDANTGTIPALDIDVRVSCSSAPISARSPATSAKELGVGGYLTRLRRTRVGRFALPDDASGLIASESMLDTRTHTVTAHTDQKTFTNREGQTVTRNKCVLNTPEGLAGDERRNWLLDHALTMEQAARGAMPALTSLLRRPANYASAAVSSVQSASPLPPLCRKRMMWRRLSSVPTLIKGRCIPPRVK